MNEVTRWGRVKRAKRSGVDAAIAGVRLESQILLSVCVDYSHDYLAS